LSDAIIKLIQEKPLAQQLGEVGYQRARNLFTREQMIMKIDHLYRNVLSGKVGMLS